MPTSFYTLTYCRPNYLFLNVYDISYLVQFPINILGPAYSDHQLAIPSYLSMRVDKIFIVMGFVDHVKFISMALCKTAVTPLRQQ